MNIEIDHDLLGLRETLFLLVLRSLVFHYVYPLWADSLLESARIRAISVGGAAHKRLHDHWGADTPAQSSF